MWNTPTSRAAKRRLQRLSTPQPIFMRPNDAAALRLATSLGVHATLGQWTLAQLDAGALQTALAGPASLQLDRAPVYRPLSIQTLQDIDATALVDGSPGRAPMQGTGVLVGIIDTGLDLTHPAFKKADGTSRVVAFWDQDGTSGSPPVAFGYGQECTAAVIHAGNCPLGDTAGHGTHVAGIAAGSLTLGVAPETDLAVVSSSDFTRLADAVSYLMHVADDLDEPLVINISVGGQYGPHDGLTPLEVAINDMTRPGRLVVAAAGNDGDNPIHIATTLSSIGQRATLAGLPWASTTQTMVELWTAPGDDAEITVEDWQGGSVNASLPLPAAPGEMVQGNVQLSSGETVHVTFAHDPQPERSLIRHVAIFDLSDATNLYGDDLVINITGTGQMQGWISQSDYADGASRFGVGTGANWLAGDGQRSISVPATARNVIAVGSYTVQTTWTSQTGGMQALSPAPLGSLSNFSSMGPAGFSAATGFKPDLTAPGSVVLSARSISVPESFETVTPRLMVMQGTSMAAPHVAGVVALMLQANPTLQPREVRDILRQSARSDAFTGATPNYNWGYGKVDAAAAVRAAAQGAQGCQEVSGSALSALLALAWLGSRRRAA